MVEVKLKLSPSYVGAMPKYETEGSAGFDLRSVEKARILPGETRVVRTGLFIELPMGYELQVRSRSGLSLNYGIIVLNSPGTVDSDYRGEIKVILKNTSEKSFKVEEGKRIAQAIIAPYIQPTFTLVDELSDTGRGENGFGSTGLN